METYLRGTDLLDRFSVAPGRGFLPAEDPLRRLPDTFAAWEDVAAALPKLLAAGVVRREVAALPQLDPGQLSGAAERNRAMLLLSYLAHSYIFGGDEAADRLPAVIARPWHHVATALGRPPVLSYATHALNNWRLLDPAGGIELGNIARLANFLGGVDEDWFVLVHVAIEAAAGQGLLAAVTAQDAAADRDAERVITALHGVADSLDRMLAILRRMPERCDPYIYYHRVRPYIFGWLDNPALPEGVWYEGVAEYGGRPRKFRGETGAQSSVIPAFDAVLGVDLSHDPLGAHVLELRVYMPPEHQEFLTELERRPSVREFVAGGGAELAEAYNRCVDGSMQFRRQHLEYAGSYIHAQQQRSAANPVATGTGGTPFMTYLSQHVRDIQRYFVTGGTA